jgi:hypothetical protein
MGLDGQPQRTKLKSSRMEIKTGHYINDVWICDACIKNQEEEHEK